MNHLENSQVPSFESWKASSGIHLSENSPRNLRQLYHDIYFLQEVALQKRDNELVRYGKVASIDIFYKSNNGKTYKLEENRYQLKPGRTIQEVVQQDDMTALTPSSSRPATHSVTERMKIHGEESKDAAIRALHEELFDATIKETNKEYANLDLILEQNLTHKKSREVVRGPYAPGNSYQGLTSIYEETNFSIEFTSDMDTPITQNMQGVPQRLYEYVPENGYVNLFIWNEVNQKLV